MLQAVIFDMDGVLVDSYRAHFESWGSLAAEHAIPFDDQTFAATFGRTSRDIIRLLWQGRALGDGAVQALDDRKEALYRDVVGRDFPAMDGARELLDALAAAGIPLAVGSSGPPENVELAVEKLGGPGLFGATVTGRDVERGKPDPEVFLLAAERLGAPPANCVVIEDAPDGIEAARAAGMAAVALLSSGRAEADFRQILPDLIVGSLRELSPAVLRAVLN